MATLIPRPAVKRVNRVVVVPKTARQLKKQPILTKPTARLQPEVRPAREAAAPRPTKSLIVKNQRSRGVGAISRPKFLEWRNSRPRQPDATDDPKNIASIVALQGCGRGRALVIVGNGPSVSEIDLSPLAHQSLIDVMSINKPVAGVWPSKYWLFCDMSQYKRHEDLWQSYNGVVINTKAIRHIHPRGVKIKASPGFGFNENILSGVHVGQSSVYVAMQVASWMDYDKVYIFGIDMTSIVRDGQVVTHFFGINPDVPPEARIQRFDKEAKHYEHASRVLSDEQRQRYVFCSSYLKYGFADRFQRLDHLVAVNEILNRHAQ